MNKSLSAEAGMLSASHPHISRHMSVFSILISLSVALVGIACVVLSLNFDDSSSTLSMAFLTLGTVLILVSLYRIFWKSADLIYIPTGSTIQEGSCYVDSVDLSELQHVMEKKDFSPFRFTFKQSGNGRMDYMVSKDKKFVAVQLFQFVPYNYEPITEVYYFTDDDASVLANRLGISHH